LCEKSGLIFWDYGNAFLLEVSRAQRYPEQISGENDPSIDEKENKEEDSLSKTKFKYPSYMQDVLGDIFSLGFGPFRWICTSGTDQDLKLSDETAQSCFETILAQTNCKKFNILFYFKIK